MTPSNDNESNIGNIILLMYIDSPWISGYKQALYTFIYNCHDHSLFIYPEIVCARSGLCLDPCCRHGDKNPRLPVDGKCHMAAFEHSVWQINCLLSRGGVFLQHQGWCYASLIQRKLTRSVQGLSCYTRWLFYINKWFNMTSVRTICQIYSHWCGLKYSIWC